MLTFTACWGTADASQHTFLSSTGTQCKEAMEFDEEAVLSDIEDPVESELIDDFGLEEEAFSSTPRASLRRSLCVLNRLSAF